MRKTLLPVDSDRFLYRAATKDGRVRMGILAVTSRAEASAQLEQVGLTLLHLARLPSVIPQRPVSRREVAVAFQNVAALVEAGVPFERAVALSEPLSSPRLARTLAEVRRHVREGSTAAEALAAFPSVFPRSVVGIVAAGETGSSLPEACRAVADDLDESAELESRVRAALAYPLLILIVGLVTIVVMGTVVIPRFAVLLEDLGAELPSSTAMLLEVAMWGRHYGTLLALALPLGLWAGWECLRQERMRVRVEAALLAMPIIGSVRHGFATSRACRALGGMLERGMPLLAALEGAAEATGNLEVSRRIDRARAAVAKGTPLTKALETERAIDHLAMQLIAVGESSGRLGTMASRASEVARQRAERSLRTAVSLLEPLLVVLLGIAVAAVAAALLQAVYSIRPA